MEPRDAAMGGAFLFFIFGVVAVCYVYVALALQTIAQKK